MRSGVDREARRIVDAVADHRPAIVASRLNAIQLVSALRSVLVGPQFAGSGVDQQPLHVAMSVAPDLRLRSGTIHERVVRGHAPVVMQPDRKSTRLNSSHLVISYAVFCLKKRKNI